MSLLTASVPVEERVPKNPIAKKPSEERRMGCLKATYYWVLNKSAHPRAPWFLALISFSESSFFPIPPDVMLIPMSLAARSRGLWFATLCTLSSVLGGVFGYVIGYYFFELIGLKIIGFYHLQGAFENLQVSFQRYGVWIVFVAGFTPIPYKVFTIGAGVFQMAMLPFVLASVVGRGGRFFLLCGLITLFGPKILDGIDRYFNWLAMAFVALLIGGFLLISTL